MPRFNKLEEFTPWLNASNMCQEQWLNTTCQAFYTNLALNSATCQNFKELIDNALTKLNTSNLNLLNNAFELVINDLRVNISKQLATDCLPTTIQEMCTNLVANTGNELFAKCLDAANNIPLTPQLKPHENSTVLVAFFSALIGCTFFICVPLLFCKCPYKATQRTTIKITPLENHEITLELNRQNLTANPIQPALADNQMLAIRNIQEAFNDSGLITIELDEETPRRPITYSNQARSIQGNSSFEFNQNNNGAALNETHTSLTARMM